MINLVSLKSFTLCCLSTVGLSLTSFTVSSTFSTQAACAQSNIKVEEIWSSPKFIEGRGVTNCGAARISRDVASRCQQQDELNSSILDVVDTSWYNASRTNDRTWDGKRSCVYRATYRCKFLVRKQQKL